MCSVLPRNEGLGSVKVAPSFGRVMKLGAGDERLLMSVMKNLC